MWQAIRGAFDRLGAPIRTAVARLRVRRRLAASRPIPLPGSNLRFTADSADELAHLGAIAEGWTADWVRHLPAGAVLWHVGAGIGLFALLAAENRNVAKVVAIERDPGAHSKALRNVMLNGMTNRVDVLPPGRSSDPLDEIAAAPGLPAPTHLRIGVGRNTRAVLAGGDRLLRDARLRGLQIEVIDDDPSVPERRSAITFLEARGWQLSDTTLLKSDSPIVADLQFTRPG